ncbi:hypothetical protein D3C87_1503540 [compost metagenome]
MRLAPQKKSTQISTHLKNSNHGNHQERNIWRGTGKIRIGSWGKMEKHALSAYAATQKEEKNTRYTGTNSLQGKVQVCAGMAAALLSLCNQWLQELCK